MKTLIFNGSPRNNGGTATLIKELKINLAGEVEVISSYKSNISPCVDCRYCWTNDKCSLDDEMQKVYQLIDESDNIVIASPIYFSELTGSLLNLMSRL
ncbi:flavodoxin family protein [Eubacteriales bacterium OttesenSCG-928-G02]|nr:flavodoxin family protein [Eubacteriales bacterium OttesenSCG-928-G02]